LSLKLQKVASKIQSNWSDLLYTKPLPLCYKWYSRCFKSDSEKRNEI